MKLEQFDLDRRAIDYIYEVLTNSASTLAKYFLDEHNLEKGKVFTILPKTVSNKEIYQFTVGRKLPIPKDKIKIIKIGKQTLKVEPIPTTKNWLARWLYDLLKIHSNSIIIFDGIAKPNHPWLSKRHSHVMIYRQEVYHFLSSNMKLNIALIKHTINEADTFPTRGFFVLSDQVQLQKWQGDWVKISTDDLKSLAKQTRKVIVGAYDFESYLIWEKD